MRLVFFELKAQCGGGTSGELGTVSRDGAVLTPAFQICSVVVGLAGERLPMSDRVFDDGSIEKLFPFFA